MSARRRINRDSRSSNRRPRMVLAIDVGGTKVEAALIDENGKVIGTERRPMVTQRRAADGLRSIREAADALSLRFGKPQLKAIGVSVPGWVDGSKGQVLRAANLPCWRNYPLAEKLRHIYGLPVRLENDANAAAQAEAQWGAGRGYRRFFYVSLGTGIGTGMAYATQDGWHLPPSEGGHMTINFAGPLCPCGKRGCIEMYASGKAIAREARLRLKNPAAKAGLLRSMLLEDLGNLDAAVVARAAQRGDRLAQHIIATACDRLALWLGNVLDILQPEAIVFGGGLGNVFLAGRARIEKALKAGANRPAAGQVKILRAQFGSQSSLIGAGALWSEAFAAKGRWKS